MKTLVYLLLLTMTLSTTAQTLIPLRTSLDPSVKCQPAQCLHPVATTLKIHNDFRLSRLTIIYFSNIFETVDVVKALGVNPQFGGKEMIADWLVDPSLRPHSLIVQADGIDPWTDSQQTVYFVFGFSNDDVCLRGRASSNEMAQILATSNTCVQDLKITKPYTPVRIQLPL